MVLAHLPASRIGLCRHTSDEEEFNNVCCSWFSVINSYHSIHIPKVLRLLHALMATLWVSV